MSIVSAAPGQTVNAVIKLPRAAIGPVKWSVFSNTGKLVFKGSSAPAGVNVAVEFVLPSNVEVPLDKSRYSITATDGQTAATEYFEVIAIDESLDDVGVAVAYMKDRDFIDVLILPEPADEVSVQVFLADGTALTQRLVGDANDYTRRGSSYVYSINAGILNTQTSRTMGIGTVVWDYTLSSQVTPSQELHPFYTMTPYASSFTEGIRRIVDRARMGDANPYMAVTTADLLHALLRGADYVMQSEPLATGFPLDLMPNMLRDYIIKAGAIDALRSLYLAEGMSAHDMQGLGVQLNVDRTQYLDGLINQLTADLEKLATAKKKWLEQGHPMGMDTPAIGRPIGILGLSTGTYTNFPMVPIPFRLLSSSLYSWTRFGSLV